MLITEEVLRTIGCCEDIEQFDWILPIDTKDITVDLIMDKRINIFALAIATLVGNYKFWHDLSAKQLDLTSKYRLAYYDLQDAIRAHNKDIWRKYIANYQYIFDDDLDARSEELFRQFTETYVPLLIKFLEENETLIDDAVGTLDEEDED